jgi:hypothetical protein
LAQQQLTEFSQADQMRSQPTGIDLALACMHDRLTIDDRVGAPFQ